ncbi:MAG: hypothetical protein ACYTHJ_05260 [Planctomycetota bacterium]
MATMTANFVLGQLLLPLAMMPGTTPDESMKNAELPTGAAVVDRHVEVTGGRAAYARIHNRVRHDRVVHVGMGFEDKAVIYTARPNKRYMHVTSEVIDDIENGSDGNIVWYQPPGANPRIETGEARLAQLSGLAFDRLDNWRAHYEKAELVQETTIDARACYEVLMTPKVGRPETHFYEKESGILVRTRRTRLSSFMQTIVLDISLSDYRAVDGVLLPHKRHQKFEQCGNPYEIMFITESVEQNVALPADRFTPPKRVMAAATAESIGGLVKNLVSGERKPQLSPCRTTGADKVIPGAENKGEARSNSPCGGS